MLVKVKYVTMEKFWTWAKLDGLDSYRTAYSDADRCIDFEKDIWFELGKRMWKKHWRVFQDHVIYIHNDITKPFRIGILQYANSVREMHNLEKYLPPP